MRALLFILALPLCAQHLSMSIGTLTQYNDQFTGANGQPNTGRYSDHDSTVATWCDDGNTYVTADDGLGAQAALTSGRNVFVNSISDDHLTETIINSLDNFGTITQINTNGWSDGASWKSSGLICVGGVLRMFVYRQTYPPNAGSYGTNGSWITSRDHGATWCNYNHTNHTTGACTITTSATGDAPTNGQSMFGSSTGILGLYALQYGKDGTIGTVIDSNDTYQYFFADGSDLLHVYLLRCLKTDFAKMDGSLYEYWTGSGWSSTASSKSAVFSGCNSQPFYVPQLRAYVASSTEVGTGLSTFYQATSITGPWTTLAAFPDISGVNQVFLSPLLKTLTVAANVATVYYISTGGFQNRTGNPATNKYAPTFNLITFTAPISASMSGNVSASGPVSIQ